jgi:DNA topoisomerase VI subunit B
MGKMGDSTYQHHLCFFQTAPEDASNVLDACKMSGCLLDLNIDIKDIKDIM